MTIDGIDCMSNLKMFEIRNLIKLSCQTNNRMKDKIYEKYKLNISKYALVYENSAYSENVENQLKLQYDSSQQY